MTDSEQQEADKRSTDKLVATGQDFMATFMESVRQAIDTLSELPNDLSARIDDAVGELESRFESRMQSNRAGLFNWIGIPDPERLTTINDAVERLEQRLEAIETNVKALEEHPKGEPWPDQMPKRSNSRRHSS